MNLISEIQSSLLQQGHELGPILLKLRFLASRLGSDVLENWVKHEADGYPDDVVVPNYRVVSTTYTGVFSGPFNSGIRNAPIPPALIIEFAGRKWVEREMRQSIAGIDALIKATDGGNDTLNFSAGNLPLLLQGNVYEGYACNSVTGHIGKSSLIELQYAVRGKILGSRLIISTKQRRPPGRLLRRN